MAQISCNNISLSYDGVCVSHALSFEVSAGDYFCIVGENGSGKTTLMKALLGLKEPDDGKILLGDGLRGGEIGYLPQRNEAQNDFPASVREVVLSGCIGHGNRRERKERAEARMRQFGLLPLADRPFSRLSGGQQKKALLARALCAAEKVLLLDEPAAALDPRATEELYEIVERLNREDGVTVLMITHDLSAVMKYATKVLHMGQTPVLYESAQAYGACHELLGGEATE